MADDLNRDCYCITVDREALHDSLEADLRDAGLPDRLLESHSHLFAESPVFLSQGHIEKMKALIRSVERVVENGLYRDAALAAIPENPVPQHDFGPRGVFFSYDFHLGADGPQLIEINTNAGGVLLNLYLAKAQQACCAEVATFFDGRTDFAGAENELIAMFEEEFRLQRPDGVLRTIAIVDTAPSTQFLYPEFLLFQSLLERHGLQAAIADPKDFEIKHGALWLGELKIDLVYNRLTDFYLTLPESACLSKAYRNGLAVFTPSPYVYALYADKRNLPLLSDSDRLRQFGVDEEAIGALGSSLPTTVSVTRHNADQLWRNRKQLFFKPATGYARPWGISRCQADAARLGGHHPW